MLLATRASTPGEEKRAPAVISASITAIQRSSSEKSSSSYRMESIAPAAARIKPSPPGCAAARNSSQARSNMSRASRGAPGSRLAAAQ